MTMPCIVNTVAKSSDSERYQEIPVCGLDIRRRIIRRELELKFSNERIQAAPSRCFADRR